jgi:uncharacterized caspase-like protein
MKRATLFFIFTLLICVYSRAGAVESEKRLALVIGNAAYKAQPLPTTVNDAALISQTLQSAGFEVTGARDLDQSSLREAVRSFTNKAANAGTGAVVFVYFAGYAVQFAGDNFLMPVGVDISDAADIPARALSLSELMHSLSALNSKSTFIVLDGGRAGPFVTPGQAGGLAWVEAETKTLIAFSTAPGTLAHDPATSYGAYARALAEMIREGGLTPANLFDRIRLRVHDLTAGGQVPWDASRIETPFKFSERAPGPGDNEAAARVAQFRLQPMRALGAQNAYVAALLRDTFDAYADFLADYWQDPMTKRVRALLAARRESITWKRTCQANDPAAYWSYLERYPSGPHAAEANRLLARLGAATPPPSKFVRLDYDVPPPLPDELEYTGRPALALDEPSFGFEAPPPIPANIFGPPPRELPDLKPPATSQGHTLPVLNLPMQVSDRVPTDTKAASTSSNNKEAGVIKPAVDFPVEPQKQVASPLASQSPPPKSAPDPATEKSSVGGGATPPNGESTPSGNQTLAKADRDRSDQNEGTSALQPGRRTAQAIIPAWLTDVVTARNAKTSLGPSVVAADMPQSGPSMFASASAGLTFQTWRYGLSRTHRTVRALLPADGTTASQATATITAPTRPRRRFSTVKPASQSHAARDPQEPLEPASSDQ